MSEGSAAGKQPFSASAAQVSAYECAVGPQGWCGGEVEVPGVCLAQALEYGGTKHFRSHRLMDAESEYPPIEEKEVSPQGYRARGQREREWWGCPCCGGRQVGEAGLNARFQLWPRPGCGLWHQSPKLSFGANGHCVKQSTCMHNTYTQGADGVPVACGVGEGCQGFCLGLYKGGQVSQPS